MFYVYSVRMCAACNVLNIPQPHPNRHHHCRHDHRRYHHRHHRPSAVATTTVTTITADVTTAVTATIATAITVATAVTTTASPPGPGLGVGMATRAQAIGKNSMHPDTGLVPKTTVPHTSGVRRKIEANRFIYVHKSSCSCE